MEKEKKEIWIEKLIELLNEFEKERIEKINSEWKLFVKLQFRPYTEESLTNKAYRSCQLEICSKYYWFIKWLVENDKIERWKFEVEYTDKQTLKDVYIAWAKQDELLIMLLSISDTPIEDLISYLK